GIVFQSWQALFRLRPDGTFDVWDFPSEWRINSFWAADTLWVQRREDGLLRWRDGAWETVSALPALRETPIDAMLEVDGTVIIGTRDRGLYRLTDGQVEPFASEADGYLRRNNVYRGLVLPTGEMAFATLNGGLVVLDRGGGLLRIVDRRLGLRDDTVYALAADQRGGLWLGLSNGLARVEIPSPLSLIDSRLGFQGFPQSLVEHDGQLWVGHTRGLGILVPSADPAGAVGWQDVSALDGQTGSLTVVDDRLLITSGRQSEYGVWELRGSDVELVRPSADHSTVLLHSRQDNRRVWIGLNIGLASIRLEDGVWRDEGRVPGIDVSARTLIEDAAGRVWMGTEGAGVFRIDTAGAGAPIVERFGTANGLVQGYSYLYGFGEDILVATPRGLLRHDAAADLFVPETRFGEVFADGTRKIQYVIEDERGGVWILSSDATGPVQLDHAVPRSDGSFAIEETALRRVEHLLVADTESTLFVDDEGVVWVSGSGGLIRFDESVAWRMDQPFAARLRSVTAAGAGSLFGGERSDPNDAPAELPHRPEFVRFEFAAPVFENAGATRYQYRLDGLEDDWSAWTPESSRTYTGLPGGRYVFRVRARDVLGQLSAEDTFAFRVAPAWFQTASGIAALLTLFSGLVWAAASIQSRRLRGQTRRLEAVVAERTRELLLVNDQLAASAATDHLTGLPNRRGFTQRATEEVERVEEGSLLFTLMLADIDDFKSLNDRYGHDFGDIVLETVAATLRSAVRSRDLVARWGGEEFAFLLPETSVAEARDMAAAIRELVAALELSAGGDAVPVSLTFGIASYEPSLSIEQALKRADIALYHGKELGKDQAVDWRPSLPAALR
ncbi:MAG: diguanylate cyclase, partial [Pseudomonadota bacterium]